MLIKMWLNIATQYRKTTRVLKGAKDWNNSTNVYEHLIDAWVKEKLLGTMTSTNANERHSEIPLFTLTEMA